VHLVSFIIRIVSLLSLFNSRGERGLTNCLSPWPVYIPQVKIYVSGDLVECKFSKNITCD